VKSVEEYIEKRYIGQMYNQLNDSDRSGIHVTDLVSPCLRQIFYNLKMKDMMQERELTLEQAHTFWLGKKYHEIAVSNVALNGKGIYVIPDLDSVDIKFEDGRYVVYDKSGVRLGVYGYEFPVEYYDIKGQIDEIVEYDGEIYIVDKKSTKRIPYKPYDTHVRQVEIYSVLLWRQFNVKAEYGAVLYIQKLHEPDELGENKFRVKVYTWQLRDIEEIEKELLEKLEKIKSALEKDELPEANPNSLCKWCNWKDQCREGTTEIKIKKQTKLDFWW